MGMCTGCIGLSHPWRSAFASRARIVSAASYALFGPSTTAMGFFGSELPSFPCISAISLYHLLHRPFFELDHVGPILLDVSRIPAFSSSHDDLVKCGPTPLNQSRKKNTNLHVRN